MSIKIQKFSLAALLLINLSCAKDLSDTTTTSSIASNAVDNPEYQANLLAYKASDHHLSFGYYSVAGEEITQIPDSVDVIDIWGSDIANDTATSLPYVRQVQSQKGTKFLQCVWPPNVNESAEYYDDWIRQQFERHVVQNGLDGIDLDMEYGLLNSMSTANRIVFMQAVVKYLGKTSEYTVARTGEKPLLVFGTDGSIGTSLLNQFAESVDYVVFQAYADQNNYWRGNLNDLTDELNDYNAGDNAKFIPVANGESGSAWNINTTVGGTRAQILEYADWCRQQDAGGTGAYHQENDAANTPSYWYTNESIRIMNEQ